MSGPVEPARPSRLRRFARTLKGFLLWRHERGSWQYDVMCLVIFLFVVLTPPRYFRDTPVRPPAPPEVVRMGAGEEGTRYRVSAARLALLDPDDPRRAAEQLLGKTLDHPFVITRIQPLRAQDGRVVWYDVWVRRR